MDAPFNVYGGVPGGPFSPGGDGPAPHNLWQWLGAPAVGGFGPFGAPDMGGTFRPPPALDLPASGGALSPYQLLVDPPKAKPPPTLWNRGMGGRQ